MLKICVYAICKNEKKFVDKWLESMSEADYIVVLDTGSTDGTYGKLQKDNRVTYVMQQIINPWRFDVARNESMKLIPADTDICVCTDFDEVFEKGWAETLRNAWGESTNRAYYSYAWSHNEIGEPQDVFSYDKIHSPTGFHWAFPVHEVLMPDDGTNAVFVNLNEKIWLHHYPDTSKPRQYYFDLLELACRENPGNPHIQMLYAREFLVRGDEERGIKEFLKVLKMPEIDRPAYRMVLLNSLLQLAIQYEKASNFDEALWYAQEFIKEDPTYREPYLLMAEMYNQMKMYTLAEGCINAAKEYAYRHYTWVERATTYLGWLPDVASITKYNLKKYKEAVELIDEARKHSPHDMRLVQNENTFLRAYLISITK